MTTPDIPALLARAEEWKLAPPDNKPEDPWFLIRDLAAALEKGQAERDAALADAKRYRWLRGDAPVESERWSRWNLQRWDGHCWHSLERGALDATIDAMLAKGDKA